MQLEDAGVPVAPELPTPSPIQAYLESLHAAYAGLHDGEVASYIPELHKADPSWFGICIATMDGAVYEVGDSQQAFTIQSTSKPLVYGLALEDVGREAVLAKIGVEPTGDAFNEISLAPESGRPLNPMINAGAITATSLVQGHSTADKFARILAVFSDYAGRALAVDEAVFESERTTGHRNRAIGHMLRNFSILEHDPTEALELYFRQCSIAVTCRDLSVMAATLANGGSNPVTGERPLRAEYVDSVLSVMVTCGMYDYAGEWMYWVGMPAKSGVAGGIMAVLPGQLGIGVYSPRLDARGNSVRGVEVCKALSRDLDLHFLRHARPQRSAIRASWTLAQISSKRRRSQTERSALAARGDRARVYELQGDLVFAAVEAVVRAIVAAGPSLGYAVLDLRRVARVGPPASRVLLDLVRTLSPQGRKVVLVTGPEHARLIRHLEEARARGEHEGCVFTFSDLDAALEWCEKRLLAEAGPGLVAAPEPVPLGEHEVCVGLTPDEITVLQGMMERRRFAAAEVMLCKGDAADAVYFLTNGDVSVTVDVPSGQRIRLSTLSRGMSFGDLAVVNAGPRNADVRADTPVECWTLATADFARLGVSHPRIKMTILENLLRNVAEMLTRSNAELAVLSR
jgi:glutaminase